MEFFQYLPNTLNYTISIYITALATIKNTADEAYRQQLNDIILV
jgi:hypothetical protein